MVTKNSRSLKEELEKQFKQYAIASNGDLPSEKGLLELCFSNNKKKKKEDGNSSKLRVKPPTFDGTTPWLNFRKQIKAAAKTNG